MLQTLGALILQMLTVLRCLDLHGLPLSQAWIVLLAF